MIEFTTVLPMPDGVPQMKKMKAAALPRAGDRFLGMLKDQDFEVKNVCYVYERDNAPLAIQVELVSIQAR